MKLHELSASYTASADQIQERISQLRHQLLTQNNHMERLRLRQRIAALYSIRQEMLELASLTKHYYERGYHRSEKYTL